jgi:hypothetical protein
VQAKQGVNIAIAVVIAGQWKKEKAEKAKREKSYAGNHVMYCLLDQSH